MSFDSDPRTTEKRKIRRLALVAALLISVVSTASAVTLATPRVFDSNVQLYNIGRYVGAIGALGLGVGVLLDGMIQGAAHGGDNSVVIGAVAIPVNTGFYYCIFWGILTALRRRPR